MLTWIRRRPPLVVIIGLGTFVAVILFAATSWRAPGAPADFPDGIPVSARSDGLPPSPRLKDVVPSGFSPWTGEPHGWSATVPRSLNLGDAVEHGPVPDDIRGRWAIPLPLGFALGAAAGLGLVVVGRRFATDAPPDA
jgi:hypothetical protein